MIKIEEIYNYLDSISPFNSQESWDNSGLIIGNMNNEIKDIYISLEATMEIICNLNKNSLLISHHPLIFKPLKTIDTSLYPSNTLKFLIKNNISLISIHTNFDLSHLNEYFVSEILGFKNYTKKNFVAAVSYNGSFDNLCSYIQSKMKGTKLKITKAQEYINNIGIVCGAGISVFSNTKNIDCIITGDIKYHDAITYLHQGVSIIDVGHYDSEKHFPYLLNTYLKNVGYNATILDSKNPFSFK